MASDDDTDRMQGVDFGEINSVFENLSYPVTADELIDQYGDREIERTNAEPITIRELFERMGEDTFESEQQLRQMILAQMPTGSEGRSNYSDRGGSLPAETEAAEEATETTSADEQEEGESTDPDTTQRDT